MISYFAKHLCIAVAAMILLLANHTPDATAATGNKLLSGIKFNFWSGSSGSNTTQERERGAGHGHAAHLNCRYENQWQDTRHGRRLEGREQVCN